MEQEKGEAQRDFEAILSEVEDWRMSRIKGQKGTQDPLYCIATLFLITAASVMPPLRWRPIRRAQWLRHRRRLPGT
jgi:hypothetical protein